MKPGVNNEARTETVQVGEAVENIAATLADGIVEESELKVTVPKLENVMQECASLKYLLEDLCRKKKNRAKSRTLIIQMRLADGLLSKQPWRRSSMAVVAELSPCSSP